MGDVDITEKERTFLEQLPFPENIRERLVNDNRFRILGKHNIYEKGEVVGVEDFDFRNNISLGTNAMFAIGGMILKKFEKGGDS